LEGIDSHSYREEGSVNHLCEEAILKNLHVEERAIWNIDVEEENGSLFYEEENESIFFQEEIWTYIDP